MCVTCPSVAAGSGWLRKSYLAVHISVFRLKDGDAYRLSIIISLGARRSMGARLVRKKLPPIHPGEHLADILSEGDVGEWSCDPASGSGESDYLYHPGQAWYHCRHGATVSTVLRHVRRVLDGIAGQIRHRHRAGCDGPTHRDRDHPSFGRVAATLTAALRPSPGRWSNSTGSRRRPHRNNRWRSRATRTRRVG
jgi:hypothetical protein